MAGAARVCPKCKAEYGEEILYCPKDGSPLTSRHSKTRLIDEDPYLGLTIADQFRVEQLVGIGAMGRVYRAHQKGIDRQVAIKILHRELLRKPNVSARFQREAKVASLLLHPNVVQVMMIGEVERLNADVGGEGYLVMEYLDGISLRSALASAESGLPLPRALHIALQVCDAVGEAHAQGVVHRDLKPENVMLVRRGDDRDFVKVLDFGVARIDWADNTVATQAGVIFGTARYISPEGAQGEPVTAASDVYSIATLLFECLAGRTPFDGDSSVAILIKQSTEPPPALRSIARASYVPEPIARLLARNLSKSPAQRCRDARELGRALVEAARDGGIRADDLVLRSTLLGEGRSATLMTSMERTRQLEVSADLAAKLEGKKPPGGTQLIDDEGQPVPRTEAAAPSARRDPAPAPPKNHNEVPRSQVEPTLADVATDQVSAEEEAASRRSRTEEPQAARRAEEATSRRSRTEEPQATARRAEDAVLRGSTPDPREAHGSTANPALRSSADQVVAATRGSQSDDGRSDEGRSNDGASDTGSFPDSGWEPPSHPRASSGRRALVIALCFVAGATLALVVAMRLGVFKEGDSGVERYARRARTALAQNAMNAPPEENVLDITNEALEKWPGDPTLLEIRREAAHRLVVQAQLKMDEDLERAQQLAHLALELDPDSQDARRVLEAGIPAPAPPPQPSLSTTPIPEAPRIPRRPPARLPVPPPSASASAAPSAEPSAGADSDTDPPKTGGRWL